MMDPARARLVSRFGVRRGRATGEPRMHAGIDVSTGSSGDPVYTVKAGTVSMVTSDASPRGMTGYGNAVVIRHDGGKYALYAHLASTTVREGQTVADGQQIGTMGNTTNGQFSPLTGESRSAFEARMRSEGKSARIMAPHLHFEVRTSRADGSSPFPGPYPQRPDQALYNLDPSDWLRSKGMTFTRRGGIEIAPESSASRGSIASRGVAGLLGLGNSGDGLSQAPESGGTYEPTEFERDVTWGLTPLEWSIVGASSLVVGTSLLAFLLRRSRPVSSNRPGPRKNRLRRWGEK